MEWKDKEIKFISKEISHSSSVPTWWRRPYRVTRMAQISQNRAKRTKTYPTVTPCPFSVSTRMSKMSSPVLSSRSTAHQFLLPIMNFCFRGCPLVSLSNNGSYRRSISGSRSKKRKSPLFRQFQCCARSYVPWWPGTRPWL